MRKDIGTREERQAIAEKVLLFLDRAGRSRKSLINQAPHKLSESTINKFFQGQFSHRTLTKIEAILGSSFQGADDEIQTAPRELGAYTLNSVTHLLGDYLCVRPRFSNPTILNVYLIHVGWDPGLKHLIYEERERSSADAKHARNGSVHIPFGSPFMYLVCRDGGFVRLMLLSQPDDNGLARGLLCTLSNPRGAIFIPAATAVFLRRLQAKETPQIGLIKPEDASYEGYQETLSTVITEEFGAFIFPQGVVERRRELTTVNS